jgi:hypothetical protein
MDESSSKKITKNPEGSSKSFNKREGRLSKTKRKKSRTILSSNYLSAIVLNVPVKCHALLDSGASDVNTISYSYFQRLKKLDSTISLCNTYDEVTPYGGKSLKSIGSTVIELILPDGTKTTPIRFTIIEDIYGSNYELILGTPAWQQLRIKPDFDSGKVMIMGNEYNMIKNYYQKSAEIRLSEPVILRAGYTTKVPVEVDNSIFSNDPNNYHSVIPSAIFNDCKVLRSPNAVVKKELNHIQISNLSNQSIKLMKGALVAHLIPKAMNIHHLTLEEIYEADESEDDILGDNMFVPIKEDYLVSLKEKIEIESNHLNKEQQSSIINIITKFKNLILFQDSLYPKSVQTKTKATVPLKPDNNDPLRFVPYRYSPKTKEFIKTTVEGLMSNGLITKSTSPWSFPVVVAIKNDKMRFCVDYSKLSEKVIKDSFPLPRIDDTFDHLSRAKYFTVVDAASGFWQVPIKEEDKEKLAFCTPFGNYQWNVMPFGFTNAPAIYQRAMNETLDGSLFINALVYIDDIIIFSESFDQHLKDIEEVFSKLETFGWKLKLKKCRFAQEKIEYLGHVLSEGQVTVLPRNIQNLKNMKRPKNIKETQAFLGAINYYRRFIQGLSYITEPLLVNLRNKEEFIWSSEQEDAFNKIVELLSKQPILKLADYEKEFILKTDASGVGYGGVLCQVHNGVEHPVHFFSGSFNKPQRLKWNHWQREAYAVIVGIKKFDHYLRDKPFTVVTDNESILTLIKPESQLTHHMIDRWRLFLSSYQYKIVHRPGKFLVLEDYLSRSYNFFNLTNTSIITRENIIDEQKNDATISQIISVLSNPNQQLSLTPRIQNLMKMNKDNFSIIDGVLYYIKTDKKKEYNDKRLVVPQALEVKLIKLMHDLPTGGHLATSKIYWKISQDVWFEDMYSKIDKYCKSCEICDKNRAFRRNDVLHPIISTREFEIIQFDHVGPFPETHKGNKYVLSVIDHFTRKRFFLPVADTTAVTTFQALLDNVFTNFEFPETILTDQGSSFTSLLAEEFAKVSNINISFALPEQHDTMGSVENSNQQLENIIRKFVDEWSQQDWDGYVRLAAYALNKSVSRTHEYAPDYLLMGIKPKTGLSSHDEILIKEEKIKDLVKARELANRILEEYRNKMSLAANKNINEKNKMKFKKGDLVQYKRPDECVPTGLSKKLASKSIGVYEVTDYDEMKGNVTIRIAPDTVLQVKQNQLRIANAPKKNEENLIKPTKLNEVIKINDLKEIEKIKNQSKDNVKSKWITDRMKEDLDIKDLVGKRILVEWKHGKTKGDWKGLVIGYTSNFSASLIYYDTRTDNVPVTTDYYSENLTKKNLRWKLL